MKTVLSCSVLVAPGLRVDWAEEDQRQGNIISVPPEVYIKGCVQDVDDGLAVSIFIKVVIIISTHLLLLFRNDSLRASLAVLGFMWCFNAGG